MGFCRCSVLRVVLSALLTDAAEGAFRDYIRAGGGPHRHEQHDAEAEDASHIELDTRHTFSALGIASRPLPFNHFVQGRAGWHFGGAVCGSRGIMRYLIMPSPVSMLYTLTRHG